MKCSKTACVSHTDVLPLCFAQCLAHVEAFIDFSEDELIEDGVLNQGKYTLCPLC